MARYISTDYFFECETCRHNYTDGCHIYCDHCEMYYPSLAKFPIADVVEAKHGEWIWKTEDKYKCSHCHYATRVDEVMGIPQYKYCPNCGAKMDVKEN